MSWLMFGFGIHRLARPAVAPEERRAA
jgi:hypothetical protein